MPAPPQLSVLLTSHTDHEHTLSLIGTLLGFELSDCEYIYVGHPAESGPVRAVEELFRSAPPNQARFITLDQPMERAGALNRAVTAAKGQLLWAPRKAERANKVVLKECLRRVSTDPAGCWVLDRALPNRLEDWIEELQNGLLPKDERFIFNRAALPAEEFRFRDGLGAYTGAELAFRISNRKPCQTLDSFFILEKSLSPPPHPGLIQEFLFSMLRTVVADSERRLLLGELAQLNFSAKEDLNKTDTLEELRRVAGEDARLALEQVDNYLKSHPDHDDAIKLKVLLLEKLRRHVEASELKHDLQKSKTSRTEQKPVGQSPTLFNPDLQTEPGDPSTGEEYPEGPEEQPPAAEGVRLSVIIPTTGDGKGVLQECLLTLDELCDPANSELIVIDNASIDDTFDYLENLRREQFLNIRIVTNRQNAGFARSVNQGMDLADGDYMLILHNDLMLHDGAIEAMISVLESNPRIGAVGPVVDRCDVLEQTVGQIQTEETGTLPVRQIDSCCMMLRKSTDVRLNEAYGLAWYEDADLCNRLADQNLEVAVATGARATHYHRVTTNAMGLNLEPERRWENADIYNARWQKSPELSFPLLEEIGETLEKIPMPVNPLNPPGYWLDQVEEFFTDELKTDLLQRDLTAQELINLAKILLVADKREFLRQIESRIEAGEVELPVEMLQALIRYYYNRNIYSRCHTYLNRPAATGPYFDLYRLRIAVKEKTAEKSVDLLTSLMESFPCHPELYRLAAEIHLLGGDEKEARSFFAMADQLEPESDPEEGVFEIKY